LKYASRGLSVLAVNALQLDWTKKKPRVLRCDSRCQHRHPHVSGNVLVMWQPAALATGEATS